MKPGSRLAADIGGTFTDVAFFDPESGKLTLGKTLSTPRQMVDGIALGVEKAGTRFDEAEVFLHGSTIAINTLLERKGAKTALLITQGFRDAYEIGRINRPDAYNLFFRKHVPLIERSLRFEVRERLTAEGTVHVPLDRDGVHRICEELRERGVEAVAILLLHSYANPAHEVEVQRIVRERMPHAFVTASHQLSQEYREYERVSTTAANAYIGPIVSRYVQGIDQRLTQEGFDGTFLIVQSTGGLYGSQQAQAQCVRMLESGPAAGVIGTHALCEQLGLENAIAFDMGGTTAKAGVIYQNKVLTTHLAMVGGYNQGLPIQIPLVDVFEVGTGGGSLAEVDAGGALSVGPRSAGSEPGPACYGRGGERPTVTDANLLLGRLDPNKFLGGEMALRTDAAAQAISTHVAGPLGIDVQDAADGILRIAVTKMSYAVKGVSTERGFDAAAFTLVAYGGAGPLHAAAIAREIGIREVIIPRAPGHFCAFGMLHSDLRYDTVRTTFRRVQDMDFEEIDRVLSDLSEQGRSELSRSEVRTAAVLTAYSADMRYVGQEHSVTVELDAAVLARRDRAGVKQLFDDEHQQRYGTCAPHEKVEIVTLRATVTGVMHKPAVQGIAAGAAEPVPAARRESREVYFSEVGRKVRTSVFDRDFLLAGNHITGPALIEEHASTTVVLPGDTVDVDALGNLRIRIGSLGA